MSAVMMSAPSPAVRPARRRRVTGIAGLVLGAALAAGCGETALPTPSDPIPFARSEVYEGTLAPSASGFYSFTAFTTSTIELTLTSLVGASSGQTIDQTLTVGFGVPSGMDCATTESAGATPALGPQITRGVDAGTYCVRLSDPGVLSGPAVFAVRITLRSGSAPTPAPGTITFASQVAVGGFTARAFNASVNGTLTARLESVSPGAVLLGIGIGIPTSGGGCAVTRQLVGVGPGAELSVSVAAARYCVKVFDTGTLTAPADFSVRIDHP
jgi:hypothetical protein